MSMAAAALGRREFFSAEEVREFVRTSKNFDPGREIPTEAEALVIFQNSNQKTWIVTTTERVYCILDDVRKDRPNINWSMSKKKVVSEGKVILRIKPREKTEKSEITGLIDFGDEHKDWLFSKSLFKDKKVDESLKEVITRRML